MAEGREQSAQYLMKNGCDGIVVDMLGQTALYLGITSMHTSTPENIRRLIKAGKKINPCSSCLNNMNNVSSFNSFFVFLWPIFFQVTAEDCFCLTVCQVACKCLRLIKKKIKLYCTRD